MSERHVSFKGNGPNEPSKSFVCSTSQNFAVAFPNGGTMVQAMKNPPILSNFDMGLGTTAFHLLRQTVDLNRFHQCVKTLPDKKKNHKGLSSSLKQRISLNLGKLNIKFISGERNSLCDDFGTLQEHSFIELSRDSNGDLWLLIHAGYKELSDKITSGEWYKEDESALYFEDLDRLRKISAWSRQCLAERLFARYYGTPKLAEICWGAFDTPYNRAYRRTGTICLGTAKIKRGGWYLFLTGPARGAYLIKNSGEYEYAGTVPLGLGRIKEAAELPKKKLLETVRDEMSGIYCVPSCQRARYLNCMYQQPRDILLGINQVQHLKLSPLYNFKPEDLKFRY